MSQYSAVKNAIHGKKVRIVLDDDPTFFYLGRCDVSSFKNTKGIGTITVTCDCEPYKYKQTETVVTQAVNGTVEVGLTNARKRAVPLVTVTTNTSLKVVFNSNNIWDLSAGSFMLPELELVEGVNIVTVIGTGTITFTWREGDL